jgi:import inner membrane translocase subunit TIM21
MRLNFYVQGRPPDSQPPSPESTSYLDSLVEWTQEKTSIFFSLTLDDSIEWAKERYAVVRDKSKSLFRYLSGAPLPSLPPPAVPSSHTSDVPKKDDGGVWSFAGLFSSLRPSRHGNAEVQADADQVWTDGEVHADLIRVRPALYCSFSLEWPDTMCRMVKATSSL